MPRIFADMRWSVSGDGGFGCKKMRLGAGWTLKADALSWGGPTHRGGLSGANRRFAIKALPCEVDKNVKNQEWSGMKIVKELDGCGHKRKNQPRIGANPASLWLAPRIGFAYPYLNSAGLIVPPVHPSSGPFGQILSAPQRLPMVNPLSFLFCDCQKWTIFTFSNHQWTSPS